MSSHHFVRENQEPALFIADAHVLEEELLGQLLEWSPTLLTLGEHYDTLQSRGIKVDALLCSVDQERIFLEENMRVLPYQNTYLNTLFDFLATKQNYTVNIIQPIFALDSVLPWLDRFTVNFINNQYKAVCVKQYEKWLPKGSKLQILGAIANFADLENLIAEEPGNFRVVEDGFIRVPEQKEFFIIAEEL